MLLINKTFFVGEINIVNPSQQSVTENIDWFTGKYEPQCLLMLFGYPLYKLFGTEASPRMTALLSGSEYKDAEGNTQKWQGLVHDTNQSLIAYYVYEQWARSKATVTTGKSNTTPKSEAADSVSYSDKIIFAQNAFSTEAAQCLSFLWNYDNVDGTEGFPEMTEFQYWKAKKAIEKDNNFGI